MALIGYVFGTFGALAVAKVLSMMQCKGGKIMKNKLIYLFSAVIIFVAANTSSAANIGDGIIINKPVAPTYSGIGGVSYPTELDDEMLYGMTGEITENTNYSIACRYQINTEYDYSTYVPDSYYVIVASADAAAWKNSITHVVIAAFADVFKDKDHTKNPIITIPRGSVLPLSDLSGGWYKAKLVDGSFGYIREESVRAKRTRGQFDEQSVRANLVSDALSYMGSTYRWGGRSPSGVDCSGFSGTVLILNGRGKYRNSRPRVGYPVALTYVEPNDKNSNYFTSAAEIDKKMKPGDQLYWSGHEGVYLGKGKYIHANGSTYSVSINSLIPTDPDFRDDLGKISSIYTWGTPYPQDNGTAIKVVKAQASKNGSAISKKFFFTAKIDGYAPTKIILWPFGRGHAISGDVTEIKSASKTSEGAARYTLYDNYSSTNSNAMSYEYKNVASGTKFTPEIQFVNEKGQGGYFPDEISANAISSDIYVLNEITID